VRPWHVVPAVAIVAGALAFALHGAWAAPCAAVAAAAIAHAARALGGDSPAALVGVVGAAMLAVTAVVDPRSLIALAAMAWTIAELTKPSAPAPGPNSRRAAGTPAIIAMLPATIAAVLEPACVALVPIAGARVYVHPASKPRLPQRWVIVVPLAGVLAVMLAIVMGTGDGAFGARWYGEPAAPVTPSVSAVRLADALGPMLAVAALAGLAMVGTRLAIAACVAGALLVDLRAGVPGATTLGLAALCAGIAVGRLGAMIRFPSGQAIVTATCTAILLVPPTWLAISR
jgi:hypothetical protein